jgi:hypothetical protein
MKPAHHDLRKAHGGALAAFGPLPPLERPRWVWHTAQRSRRSSLRCACTCGARAGGPGYVLRPTLARHRIRPASVAPSTRCSRAQVDDTANGACARTPNHLPRHPGGMRMRGRPPSDAAGGRWCPRAQAPFAVASTIAGRSGVDAAERCRHRRCPASVGRRTGAAPPPWRRDVGRQTDPGLAALGRKQSFTPHRRFMRRGSRAARWSH